MRPDPTASVCRAGGEASDPGRVLAPRWVDAATVPLELMNGTAAVRNRSIMLSASKLRLSRRSDQSVADKLARFLEGEPRWDVSANDASQ